MKKILTIAAAASVLSLPMLAIADDAPYTFTGNVTLASEYIYRGIEQTAGKPAIQGGFDFAHSSGFYLGVWGSNISWISDGLPGTTASVEMDVYGGYKNTFAGGDWNYDIGVLSYVYPVSNFPANTTKPDTTEVYGAIGWKWLTLKYSHVVSSHIFGFNSATGGDTRNSGYVDLTGTYDLGSGWGVSGHVGHQKIKDFSDASYTDYKIGATKDVGLGTVGLYYSDTNAKSCGDATPVYCNLNNRDLGKGRVVLTFSKSL
ncbi:MAG: TorF family putative porin [Rugosibacter sp.]|jgi:uncharacterized protein (TIGR02001 family)|nr:hypothetical protein [Rugosibacter sp.]